MIYRTGGAQLLIPGVTVHQPMAGVAAYDADAEILFAAMTTEPDATRKALISDTIADLKTAGIWTELDELWFLAAHAEQAGLLGWKRLKDCLAVNAPTFTTDRGFAGNGTTSYLNTQFVPSTDGVQYTLNDASFGVYSRTNSAVQAMDMASFTTAGAGSYIATRWSTVCLAHVNQASDAGRINFAIADSLGLFVPRRTASGAIQLYRNGVQASTGTSASVSLSAHAFFVGARNNNGTPSELSIRQIAFAFVGASLSTQQQADLFTIVEAHLDAIGAGVI